MKAMKKILSGALALGMIFSTVGGITSNAIDLRPTPRDSDKYRQMFEGYTEFDDSGYLSMFSPYRDYKAYYNAEKNRLQIDIDEPDFFYYEVPDDENAYGACCTALILSPEWDVYFGSESAKGEKPAVRYVGAHSYTKPSAEKYANVVAFVQKLKEVADVIEFKYLTDMSCPQDIPIDCSVLRYTAREFTVYTTYKDNVSGSSQSVSTGVTVGTRELLENFIEKHSLDYTLKEETIDEYGVEKQYITLMPNFDSTIEERFEVMKQIKDEIGFGVKCGAMPDSDSSVDPSMGIEMCNNIAGDANCDGKMTIADSTAILQSLGNPDKYRLSAQGAYNADIESIGNGVTTLDALEIQKALSVK